MYLHIILIHISFEKANALGILFLVVFMFLIHTQCLHENHDIKYLFKWWWILHVIICLWRQLMFQTLFKSYFLYTAY